jgi:DNA-binding NarL/FixJ family response regulator
MGADMNDSQTPSTAAIRVYLVEDQAMIRAAFRNLLVQGDRFRVLGDSGDPRRAIEEIQVFRPDVVLLDITMPGLSGLDTIEQILKVSPRSRIVMLTHHEGQTFVEQALRAGAEGYLSKDSDEAELALAIEAVHRGDPYVSPRVSAGLVTQVRGSSGARPATAARSAA